MGRSEWEGSQEGRTEGVSGLMGGAGEEGAVGKRDEGGHNKCFVPKEEGGAGIQTPGWALSGGGKCGSQKRERQAVGGMLNVRLCGKPLRALPSWASALGARRQVSCSEGLGKVAARGHWRGFERVAVQRGERTSGEPWKGPVWGKRPGSSWGRAALQLEGAAQGTEVRRAAGSSALRVPGGDNGQPGRDWGGCEDRRVLGREEEVEAGQVEV